MNETNIQLTQVQLDFLTRALQVYEGHIQDYSEDMDGDFDILDQILSKIKSK